MMTFVIGGSKSGKSAYAQELAISAARSGERRLYYLATMQVRDAQDAAKVEQHRALRAGRGFFTVEQPTDVQKSLKHMQAGERAALLECISTLTANEMFSGAGARPQEEVVRKVMDGVRALKEGTDDFVVVGSNVFEDGGAYEETTMEYIRAMGTINREIAALAERVVEVVVGIPIIWKGGEGGWLS